MAFKGEIALGALNSKYKYGFTVGDIYRVQGAGNLVPNNYPAINGEFIEWTADGWQHSDEHYTTDGEATEIVAGSIPLIRGAVFDNGTPSIETVIRVTEETYDAYNVGDNWTRSGVLYKITDKIHEADTDVWQFETERVSGVVPALNDIRNNGLSTDDVQNIVSLSNWERVETKIGQLDSSTISPTNIEIHYNRTLSLIYIRFYARWSSSLTGHRAIFNFNNDLPGINETQSSKGIFNFTSAGWCGGSKCGHVSIMPVTTTGMDSKKIECESDSFTQCSFAALMRFNSDLKQEFEAYIDA